jgi:hypothetical protein
MFKKDSEFKLPRGFGQTANRANETGSAERCRHAAYV